MENGKLPAFAAVTEDHIQEGLTKREYFAAMAMQGLIANAPTGQLHNVTDGTELAVVWADALLKALSDEEM